MSIKLETANPVRSFKARGTEVVASLLADTGSQAVVCASAGNLGQALAWSGRGRGLDVRVVASRCLSRRAGAARTAASWQQPGHAGFRSAGPAVGVAMVP